MYHLGAHSSGPTLELPENGLGSRGDFVQNSASVGGIPVSESPVAQLILAPSCHGGGRGLTSCPGRKTNLGSPVRSQPK